MVARCKVCGHSWNIETYDGKRKRKCPECGKFQVEYINPEDIDLTQELDKTAARKIKKIITPAADPQPEEPELIEEPDPEEEPEFEEEQTTCKTFIPNPPILIAGLALAAALSVIFLITRRFRKTHTYLEEEENYA